MEDLEGSICSDDNQIKGKTTKNLIPCSTNISPERSRTQEIKRKCFLFGSELSSNYITATLKSVVWFVDNDELLQMISYLMLPNYSLQVACCQVVASPASCPLPSRSTEASSSQESEEGSRNFPSPTHTNFFPNTSSLDTFLPSWPWVF